MVTTQFDKCMIWIFTEMNLWMMYDLNTLFAGITFLNAVIVYIIMKCYVEKKPQGRKTACIIYYKPSMAEVGFI